MKVKVTLPGGYGRTFLGKDEVIKSAPTFDVMAYDDNGNRIQEPYPTKVKMGPDMYEFLSYIMPRLAARQGEDLKYEGNVFQKPRKTKAKYAYYGYGTDPDDPGNVHTDGIGLIGYGDTDTPNISKFGYINGVPNYKYSRLLDAPSPLGSNTRSQVLTNILNDSWDFSPLFGPLYQYKDMEYDAANDPEEKGPRPTDHWVPRVDPKTGEFMRRDDGSIIFMPIPLVQSLPIYNFKHPKWEENPYEAWDMIKDPKSAMDWRFWNKAPSFADYTGKSSRTDKEEKLRPMDYLLYNMKLAEKPGYFEDFPELKSGAHEGVRDVKGQRSVEKITEARKEAAKQFEKDYQEEKDKKAAATFNKTHLRPEDTIKTSNKNMKQFYRALVGKAFLPGNEKLISTRGISPEEKNDVIKFAKDQGFEKYNKIPDSETKMIYILDDYKKSKEGKDTQNNILSGIKEPF